MGRVLRGRIAHLRWGDEENTGAAERWQAATPMHDSGPRSTTGPSHLGESRSFAPAALRMTALARFGEGKENCRGAACCAPTHPSSPQTVREVVILSERAERARAKDLLEDAQRAMAGTAGGGARR